MQYNVLIKYLKMCLKDQKILTNRSFMVVVTSYFLYFSDGSDTLHTSHKPFYTFHFFLESFESHLQRKNVSFF